MKAALYFLGTLYPRESMQLLTLNIASEETTEDQVSRVIEHFGTDFCINLLKKMLLIREFEIQGEAAYLEGLVGGLYHS